MLRQIRVWLDRWTARRALSQLDVIKVHYVEPSSCYDCPVREECREEVLSRF